MRNTQTHRFSINGIGWSTTTGWTYILSLVVVVFSFHCAHRMPPPGGPPDRTPPAIVQTDPPSGTTQYLGKSIRLRFNQYVDERSAEESIFISPYVGELEFEWSGKEVEITFGVPLQPNRTYVVTVGTDVIGYYTRTRMAQAYTLAFSTGKSIDNGVLRGMVIPRNSTDSKSGVMVYAFHFDERIPDTLNPALHTPDFMTQTGEHGEFAFLHVPQGLYRLYAVRDVYRNFLYDPEVDEFGVPPFDYVITSQDTCIEGITLQLAKEDTTGPRVIRATAPHGRKVEISLSEPLHPETIHKSSFFVVDTVTQRALEVIHVYRDPIRPTIINLLTALQDSGYVYRVNVVGCTDSSGNAINLHAQSTTFIGSSRRDTLQGRLEFFSLKDSADAVPLYPTIVARFTDALDTSTVVHPWKLFKHDTIPVPLRVLPKSLCEVVLEPQYELNSTTWYTLHANFQKLKRWDGTPIADSIRQWRFKTIDTYELSSVSGRVEGKTERRGRMYIVAIKTETSDQKIAPVDSIGTFHFSQLEGGKYIFRIFEDINNNQRYDVGKPSPFAPSEPLKVYTDTLRVRARWPLEGVQFIF